MLCAYILAQAYMIPLVPVGPSWAVWPTGADFAGTLLVLVVCSTWFLRRGPAMSRPQRRVLTATSGLWIGCFLWSAWTIASSTDCAACGTALYELTRFAQSLLIGVSVGLLSLSEWRLRILARVVLVALTVGAISVVATSLSFVSTPALAQQLPLGPESGPWNSYVAVNLGEVGTLGYNHAYTSLTLLTLLAMWLTLRAMIGGRPHLWPVALVLGAIFLSGSRNGIIVATLFAALVVLKASRPIVSLLILIAAASLVAFSSYAVTVEATLLSDALNRVATLTALDPEVLSGRPLIWSDRLSFLAEDPMRLLFGAGFGTAQVATAGGLSTNAHMLYLQILVETGFIGLAAFAVWLRIVTRELARVPASRPYLLLTLIFAVSGLTQETFYPVPASLHLMGLFLVGLLTVLARTSEASATAVPERTSRSHAVGRAESAKARW